MTQIVILFVTLLLSVVLLLAPLFIDVLNGGSVSILAFEEYISKHDGVVISLGTLFLISTLAVMAAHIANKSAELRERTNLKVQAEIQVSRFRQDWIKEMRDDLSELSQIIVSANGEENVSAKAHLLHFKVLTRLNLDEPLARDLRDALTRLIESSYTPNEAFAKNVNAFNHASGKYLKAEWARLKDDLLNAQLMGHERQ